MGAIVFCGTGLGYQAIRVDGRFRLYVLPNKGLEWFSFETANNLQAATPRHFGRAQFHRNRRQWLTFGTAMSLP